MGLFKKRSDEELDRELSRLRLIERDRLVKERKKRARIDKINKIKELKLNNSVTGKVVKGLKSFADKVDKHYSQPVHKVKKKGNDKPLFDLPF